MRKRDVRDDAVTKERRLPDARTRPIKKLIGNDHIKRRVFFLQRSDCRRRQDSLDPQQFHRVDIGAKRNFSGRETMTASVSRQKSNALAFESPNHKRVGGISERRFDANFFDSRQLRHLIEAAAADDADAHSWKTAHESSFSSARTGIGMNSFSPSTTRHSGSSGS